MCKERPHNRAKRGPAWSKRAPQMGSAHCAQAFPPQTLWKVFFNSVWGFSLSVRGPIFVLNIHISDQRLMSWFRTCQNATFKTNLMIRHPNPLRWWWWNMAINIMMQRNKRRKMKKLIMTALKSHLPWLSSHASCHWTRWPAVWSQALGLLDLQPRGHIIFPR